ncbi:hypothetical protein ScPMuIL_014199 [Solemya velum]
MSEYSSPTTSGFAKLPPIITQDSDKVFLSELNNYINHELLKIDPDDDEQRYIVYKTVFNKIIEYVVALRMLLTMIKKEYEDTIEAIKKGRREAAFLHGKLKAMASEPSTVRNFRKRSDELEDKLIVIQKDNERLQSRLAELKLERKRREQQEKEISEPPKRELKKDHRLIPGLSLEDSTDLTLLYKKLEQLDRQYKELNITYRTRYVPKARKIELKASLDHKVTYRDRLLWQGQLYKAKQNRLKIALEAAQAYNRVKPPHQTVGDAVIFALAHAARIQAAQEKASELASDPNQNDGGQGRDGSPTTAPSSSTYEDDDPNKEKEAEMMLEYIEKFNELFEDGKYEEASIHAANSPKGILRTSATLAKFRDAKVPIKDKSPLLSFCSALMSSVAAVGSKPNIRLSCECVDCALQEHRMDLLSYWISQNRLTLSEELAQLIQKYCQCSLACRCKCQALAQNVYAHLGLHHQVAICILKQGRVQTGIEYARNKSNFTQEGYIEVLRSCPSLHLANTFVAPTENGFRMLPVGVIIGVLLEINHFNIALPFIQGLQNSPSQDDELINAFQAAVLDDNTTTMDDWDELIELFQNHGHQDIAMSLMASVTVLDAMRNALKQSFVNFISDVPEETEIEEETSV